MRVPVLASALVLVVLAGATVAVFGSSKSDVYHRPTCAAVRQIHDANLVVFRSAEGAREAGYRPCRVCLPPVPDDQN